MLSLSDFAKGDRVRFVAHHTRLAGKTATVIKAIKSRRVVYVELDEPEPSFTRFDAFPTSLEKLT